ncbi:unnamed protein product [Effrenium voratum]|uniref:Wax synthase domain-containing protein n=1 Tax=Effrenium voratum TaxID=2562239 RepID=A0AA36JR55_9DINO|nr:unnamed protein product [Effrenium voratum]CAJ1410867.1 unnamed protein product [Effrenium voratum]
MWHVVFSQPDLAADSEVKTISFSGLAVLLVLGSVGYGLHRKLQRWPSARIAVLSCLGVGIVLGPFVLLEWLGPLRSRMAHFVLSFFGVVAGFRWLELICGTGPAGFDHSAKNFVIYFTSPAEVLFEEGGLKPSRDGLVAELLFRIAKHMLIGTLVLSLGKATDFSPFLEEDPAVLPLLGFPWALPAIYLQTLYVYCTLATAMLMHRLLPAFFGIDSVDPMQTPLLLSTSLRDFWGRRWNLVVHRLMKRTFFLPVAGSSAWTRRLAGLLAFMMSGVFHEYMWLAVNWNSRDSFVPGLSLLFFLVQFALCALEASLTALAPGVAGASLPAPLKTVLTTALILPFGPLFLQGIRPMALECTEQGQTFSLVDGGEGVVSGPPPLDWVLCCAVGVAATARSAWRGAKQRSGGLAPKVSVVPVLPTCEGA